MVNLVRLYLRLDLWRLAVDSPSLLPDGRVKNGRSFDRHHQSVFYGNHRILPIGHSLGLRVFRFRDFVWFAVTLTYSFRQVGDSTAIFAFATGQSRNCPIKHWWRFPA